MGSRCPIAFHVLSGLIPHIVQSLEGTPGRSVTSSVTKQAERFSTSTTPSGLTSTSHESPKSLGRGGLLSQGRDKATEPSIIARISLL